MHSFNLIREPLRMGKKRLLISTFLAFWFVPLITPTRSALAAENLTSDVTVSIEKTIDIPFPLKGIYKRMENQFAHLAWSPVTNEIAASIFQGPFVYLINPVSGAYRVLRTAERGSEWHLAWSPVSPKLAVDGFFEWHVYDTAEDPPTRHTEQKRYATRALKGVRLADGREAFVRVADTTIPEKIYLFRADGTQISTWSAFPQDGTKYTIEEATVESSGRKIYAAMNVLRTGLSLPKRSKPYTLSEQGRFSSEFDIWLANVTTGKLHCRLNMYEGSPTDAWGNYPPSWGGMAFSADGRLLAVNTSKSFDVFDVQSCKRVVRIEDYVKRDSTARPDHLAFSADGRYLVGAGIDVYAPRGGWVQVWRTSDWKEVYKVSVPAPFSLATDGTGKYFVVGYSENKLEVFKISAN